MKKLLNDVNLENQKKAEFLRQSHQFKKLSLIKLNKNHMQEIKELEEKNTQKKALEDKFKEN